ncbi:GGDEF domain-containing protein [Mesorhizobium sp. CGMCC 1.15528]|uniref:diguanylate cyclase n=2 Tax=Mesorhizobium zhangyense TaxID=1776730 RepID=A0A7C9VD54_9HYPH|nr:GGDEF domain-containing protein [Mesorhizobium zhangyense]
MGANLFIALLTPALSLVFASAFFLLWTYRRHGHVMVLCLSYVAYAVGFLLQSFDLPIGVAPTKFLSNLLLLIAAVSLATAAVARHDRPSPAKLLSLLGFAGIAALSWFLFVQPSLVGRIFAINLACSGICMVVVAALKPVPSKSIVDRVLIAVCTLAAIDFLIRPLTAIWIGGEGYGAYHASLYWLLTNFSMVLISVMLALSLTTAIALDVMKELQAESHTDPLSGLLNRRGFEERSAAYARRPSGASVPLAIVLADLDHFKSVNDTYGHAVGDAVIAAFATHLRISSGKDAIVGRIGGEEFAIVLPASDLMTARLFAEGLRASFTQHRIKGLPAHAEKVTASFGVASRATNEDFESLMRRADQALYRAKNNGRDSVKLADQLPADADCVVAGYYGGHI